MQQEHQDQRAEFNVFGMDKFKGRFVLAVFALLVSAIVYLFWHCEREKRELRQEITELRHELTACKDSAIVRIERLKNDQLNMFFNLEQNQNKIERETRKLDQKLKKL